MANKLRKTLDNKVLSTAALIKLRKIIFILEGKAAKTLKDIAHLNKIKADLIKAEELKEVIDETYLTYCN